MGWGGGGCGSRYQHVQKAVLMIHASAVQAHEMENDASHRFIQMLLKMLSYCKSCLINGQDKICIK